ncbi:hypothetical protein GCM10009557_47600 [Virgisporangium ochraceum]|uniref:Uncharacterized protein n=1 Tax=Virgisporangium ochraceum TaxID=65505 RepID=A0A8J4EG91_9ACTN|nr:hypothetical protein Voc01_085760 [Virgisporangium ochraceum]
MGRQRRRADPGETTGTGTINTPTDFRTGTVGRANAGMEAIGDRRPYVTALIVLDEEAALLAEIEADRYAATTGDLYQKE